MGPPRRRWPRALLVGLVLLVLCVSTLAPVAARPPPRPLCDGCGDSFAETAAGFGVDVTVESSTAVVHVHENGTATWVVENHVADSDGLDRLRANDTLRDDIAGRAMWDTDLLSTAVTDDGIVVARYQDDEFVEQVPGNTLRSGAFTEGYGYSNLAGLGANELTVVAPDRMRVAATVPGSTRSDDGSQMTLTEFTEQQEGSFVTFVPRDSLVGPLWSLVALGSVRGPTVVLNVLLFLGLPTAAFALLVGSLLGGLSWASSRSSRGFDRVRDREGAVLATTGALVLLGTLLAGSVSIFGGSAAPLVGAGIATVLVGGVLSWLPVRDALSYRTLLVVAVAATLVAAGVTVLAAVALNQNGMTRALLSSMRFLAPVFALLPAGYAFGRENRPLAVATAVAGFVIALLPFTPFTTPTGPFGLILVFLALVGGGIAVVTGSPLLVVGASLAIDQSETNVTKPRDATSAAD